MQDPIADMLTRIRNAHMAKKLTVTMPASNLKVAITDVLKKEGYIENFRASETEAGKSELEIVLKYFEGKPVIEHIKRVSCPSLRVYKPCSELPEIAGGLGTAIISTNKGLMTDKQAREANIGGEVLAEVI